MSALKRRSPKMYNNEDDVSEADTVGSEDIFSESSHDTDDGYSLHLIQREDVSTRESQIRGAGLGVFCKKPLEPGTILPMYAVVRKVSEIDSTDDSSYYMSISYTNSRGDKRNLTNIVSDGNPNLPSLKKLPRNMRAASYVNEASRYPPNCIFISNPMLTKEDVTRAYRYKTPIVSALLVVPRFIGKGEELFTLYGKDFVRHYSPWSGKDEDTRELQDLAHEIVSSVEDELVCCLNK
ncbi:unknown [Feldmannia species virus]|uniref:SET domain-containing protein n=1 Tax=Feldmannia species virus TaxID=39420 RepID=B5LWF2_9PHYC|nr:hypothetical protein FeldSpV_gp063 [Feldmannia species virus]ACH46815.1 unknown [Feldmannia species virus]